MRPGREAHHSPPSSAEVKNAWSCTSTPQYVFMAWCLVKPRDKFTFTCISLDIRRTEKHFIQKLYLLMRSAAHVRYRYLHDELFSKNPEVHFEQHVGYELHRTNTPDKFHCRASISNFITIRSVVSRMKHTESQTRISPPPPMLSLCRFCSKNATKVTKNLCSLYSISPHNISRTFKGKR
jgi:hypothetical protein